MEADMEDAMNHEQMAAHIALKGDIPDPDRHNDVRAVWADNAINSFARETGVEGEDGDTVLADMLTDIMHWCDRNGLNFYQCLTSAEMHYTEETADDGPQLDGRGTRHDDT